MEGKVKKRRSNVVKEFSGIETELYITGSRALLKAKIKGNKGRRFLGFNYCGTLTVFIPKEKEQIFKKLVSLRKEQIIPDLDKVVLRIENPDTADAKEVFHKVRDAFVRAKNYVPFKLDRTQTDIIYSLGIDRIGSKVVDI